jgi:hypothetical protein
MNLTGLVMFCLRATVSGLENDPEPAAFGGYGLTISSTGSEKRVVER